MMGDSLYTNFEKLKKLGFDDSNQWLFYDERLKEFFEYFAHNITDENILTEQEVLERDELLNKTDVLEDACLTTELEELNSRFPGLFDCTENQVETQTQEYEDHLQLEKEYTELLDAMRITKEQSAIEVANLEDDLKVLEDAQEGLINQCQDKAKELENVQREYCVLVKEVTDCFSKRHSPPLFVHQLPLEQYLHKCDSFMQYFSVYLKDNFKIEDYIDMDGQMAETQQITTELEKLRKSIEYYSLEGIMEKYQKKAVQSLIQSLDINRINIFNINDLKHETRRLALMNEGRNDTTNILLAEIASCVERRAQQHMELILYENTKHKYERARKRQENVHQLTKVIFDALSNAELVWILTQLDLEKTRNRFNRPIELTTETQQCLRRINLMQGIDESISENERSHIFLELVANQLAQHIKQNVRSEPKACLHEYEKFVRLQKYGLVNLLSKIQYSTVFEQLEQLDHLQNLLKPFVYDGPVITPIYESVHFLKPIFQATLMRKHLENKLRCLRQQFQDEIVLRMNKDKLWCFYQLLWIWFLTDPNRLFAAIEEVKKAAARTPSAIGLKPFGGIKNNLLP